MKVFKKLGLIFPILFFTLWVSSCTETDDPAGGKSNHEHTYDTIWEYNAKEHFHRANCEHKSLTKDNEPHIFGDWEPSENEKLEQRGCEVCEYVETRPKEVVEHIHTYGKWVVAMEPTLMSEGRLERICQDDSTHVETFDLPKLNKTSYVYQILKEPTCEENGTGIGEYTIQKDKQDFSFQVTLDSLSHTYGKWEVETEPTMMNAGSLKRVCEKNADHIERFTLPALNSKDYTYQTIKKPTCYEDGLDCYTYVKDKISFSFEVLNLSTGHSYRDSYSFDSTKHWIDPTCEHVEQFKDMQVHTFENGTCAICGYEEKQEASEGVIYTLNEDQSAYIASLDPTYQKDSIIILAQYQGVPVTSISAEGFRKSTAKFITIPGSIQEINGDAFKDCTNLLAVFYNGTIEDWCDIGFKNEYATPMSYADHFYMLKEQIWEEVTEITVPESIIALNVYQFYGFTNLSHITLPDTMLRVHPYALAECGNLEELVVSPRFIDEHAFLGCSKLTRLTLGYLDSTISLGYFFDGSNSSIPNTLTEVNILAGTQIKDYAFRGVANLTKLTLPNSLIKVGNGIVDGCDKLLYNEKENGLYLGNEENPYLILMQMKDKEAEVFTIDEQTKILAYSSFYQASQLKEIVIPSSVIEIGKNAFRYASSIKTIVIPENIKELYDYTFADCTALEEIIIPKTILSVSQTCFKSTNIKRATLPYHTLEALTTTSLLEELYLLDGDGAVNLGLYPKLQKVNLPYGITSIGDNVVESCPDLIYNEDDYCKYLGNEESPYIWLMQVKDKTISECTIQDTTSYIYSQAFMDCGQLEHISIPYSLQSIGSEAFKNNTKLWSVSFPSFASKLDIIGESAFEGCTAIEVIALPDSLSTIGNAIFENCTSLRKLTLPFVGKIKNPEKASSETLFGYIFGKGTGTAVSQTYLTNPPSYQMIEYRIPASLKEVIVQGGTLLSGAFMNCSMITNLTLSDKVDFVVGYLYTSPVKEISQFYHCKFQKVTMPSKFISLMNEESRSGLSSTITSMTITSGEEIDAYACQRMSINNLILADSIKSIGHGAFADCEALQSVKLPNQLETISNMAFYKCGLKSVYIPRSVLSIGNSAFDGCSSLEYIYLPQSIETIGSRVFYNVNATFYLEGASIPAGWDLSATRPIYYNIKDIVEVDDVIYAIRESDALFVGYAKEDGLEIKIPETIVYEGRTYLVTSQSE